MAFKRQAQAQLRAVWLKPFAETQSVDLFGTNDLYAGHDVMSFDRQATDAGQLTTSLAPEYYGTRQQQRRGHAEDQRLVTLHINLRLPRAR